MERNSSERKVGFDYQSPDYTQNSLYGYGGSENWSRKSSRFMPHQFRNEIRVKSSIPKIFVSKDAYEDMFQIVDLVAKEVGWLGTIEKTESNDYLIKEVFLFEQKSHHTTCNITEEGLGTWAMQMMESRPDDGMDIVNSVRFWGHSHVWMGTSPSGQDDAQMGVFAKSCEDFFIRGIMNKSGRMEFTLYLYELGIEIHDAEWSIYDPNPDTARKEKWQQEIDQKVGEMTMFPQIFGNKSQKSTKKSWGFRKNTNPDTDVFTEPFIGE